MEEEDMMKPKLSFVIGYRNGPGRRTLLECALNNLQHQTIRDEIEIIVIEEGEDLWLWDVPQADQVYFLYSTEAYCRSRVANVGSVVSSADYMVMHDGDILVPKDYAERMLSHFEEGYEVAHIGKCRVRLTDFETAGVSASANPYKIALECFKQRKELTSGKFFSFSIGASIMAVQRIGGWSEEYVGWGGEDASFFAAASRATKFLQVQEVPIVHLWHEPAEPIEKNQRLKKRDLKQKIKKVVKRNLAAYRRKYGF